MQVFLKNKFFTSFYIHLRAIRVLSTNLFVNISHISESEPCVCVCMCVSLSRLHPDPPLVRSYYPSRFNRSSSHRRCLASVQPRRFPICASKRKRGRASLNHRKRRSIAATLRALDRRKKGDANRSSARARSDRPIITVRDYFDGTFARSSERLSHLAVR